MPKYQHFIRISGSMLVYSDKEHPDLGDLEDLYYDSPLEHDDFSVNDLIHTHEIDKGYNQIREVELKEIL